MSADAWITAATVVVMFAALASERVPPAASVLTATIFLLVVGVIDEAAALSGFANAAPWTVAALYVLAFAGDRTGLMGPLVNRLLGKGEEVTTASTARILLPTAGISAFINNTPLVAMLIGQVTSWCNRRGVSPSKLLLPISYAAILGGILTVIGTSTNLTASGLLQESGEAPIGLFEITQVSLIPAIAGLIVLIFIVPRLLPDRKGALEEFTEDLNEFAAQMKVVAGGPLDGVTVAEAGLRNLKGIYLVELERDGHMFPAVSPSRVLRGGDRLTFVGESSQVVDFQRVTKGLESAESEHLLEVDSPEHTFYEAVVGPDSRLVGQTLQEAEFRTRYQAAVVAIRRSGKRIDRQLGKVTLEAGDTLLLLAGPDFRIRSRRAKDFLVVLRIGGPPPSATKRAPFVGILAVAVITLAAFDVLSILELSLIAAGLLIATKTVSISEAGEAIDFGVILLIAASFGVGAAIEVSGLAEVISNGLIDLFGSWGDLGIIFALALAMTILTELASNNAAVVVLYPITIAVAAEAGLDPRIMVLMIAIMASSSFLTAVGYQTNMMVYGPGGYRFGDLIRAGLPLSITLLITVTLVTWQLA
ncbi:MAG: SLC13 family permease [Solirubrobacterales bacterium]|nr:SLC13 family permease [Solirubrobacterales bacterium]